LLYAHDKSSHGRICFVERVNQQRRIKAANAELGGCNMTDKELKRLSRAEILGMLVEREKANEELKKQNEELRRQLGLLQDRSEGERAQMSAAQEQMMRAQQELNVRQEQIEGMRRELRSSAQQLESARAQLVSAQEALGAEREEIERLNQKLEQEQAAFAQAQEQIASLEREMDSLRVQLKDRTIVKQQTGSLADISAQLNGLFEAAQNTAAQYLENVERMKREQEAACARESEEAHRQAEALMQDTGRRCEAMQRETQESCAALRREAEESCTALRSQTEEMCSAQRAESKRICAEMQHKTRQECEAMLREAEDKARRKWSSVSEQLAKISMEIRNTISVPSQERSSGRIGSG